MVGCGRGVSPFPNRHRVGTGMSRRCLALVVEEVDNEVGGLEGRGNEPRILSADWMRWCEGSCCAAETVAGAADRRLEAASIVVSPRLPREKKDRCTSSAAGVVVGKVIAVSGVAGGVKSSDDFSQEPQC